MTQAETYAVEPVDEIDCRFESRPWDFSEAHAAEIDAHWRRLAEAKPKLFNGRVLLLHRGDIEVSGNRRIFRGAYLETEFKAFVAWRDFGFPDAGVRNCFASAALLSADGAFVVGEMAAHTANPGRVYFPAGTPDPQDVRAGRVDLLGSVTRELEEETGLPAGEVEVQAGWTLLVCPYRIACIKLVRSREAAETLVAGIGAFLASDPEPELARMHVLRGTRDYAGLDLPAFMRTYLESVWAAQPG